MDYEYNIRGWLTNINDIEASSAGSTIGNMDLFNFRINYNTVEGNAVNDPLYNGNIAQTIWKTANTDKQLRGYAYTYDDLNRITNAQGSRGTVLSAMIGNTEFSVENIAFDRNGNILALMRRGANENTTPSFGIWDDLTYTYNGNRLMKVVDNPQPTSHKAYGFKDGINSGDDYLYDDNGNMVKDNNKGIESITYNHLNLPSIIRFDPGSSLTNSISYIYDAMGNKLAKILNDNNAVTTTHYDGGYVYSDMGSPGNIKLQFLSQPEGYVEPVAGTLGSVTGFDTGTGAGTQSTYKYVFQYKDHLGNIRLSYSDNDLNGTINPATEIVEENNYYPFGLEHKGYNNTISSNGNALAQKWKFNGQEYNEELSLNLSEMDFRQYDPAIGRFVKIDPLSEVMPGINPYQFSLNNPLIFADPSGLIPEGMSLNDFIQDLFKRTPNDGLIHHYDSNGNQTGTTDPHELPNNPSKLDTKTWGDGSYRPEGIPEGKGHSQYWKHKDGKVILAYDDAGHYHIYENNGGRLGKRLQASGELAGYKKNGKLIYRKGAPNAHISPGTKLSFLSRNAGRLNLMTTLFGLAPLLLDSPQSPIYIFQQPGQGEQNRAYIDFKSNQIYEWSIIDGNNTREVRIYSDYNHTNGQWRGTGLILKQYFDATGKPINPY